jgi:predicted ABC-type ATPase
LKARKVSKQEKRSWIQYLDERPIVVALVGPNGAGKSTFYEAHLKQSGRRFLNADVLARELGVEACEASRMAARLRSELVAQRESFVFETVFSGPVGDELTFLKEAVKAGYAVVVCAISIADTETSEERVAMRVTQGGHDVPTEKLIASFPRTISNVVAAIHELPCVMVFDNDDLRYPFRQVAVFQDGVCVLSNEPVPAWLRPLLPKQSS